MYILNCITLFIYFLSYNWNFILQVFEDLDKMCRKELEITGQKMSKKDQDKKISAVRKQISQLQLRVQKLESSLHTFQTNPDHYFANLNTKNREYVDWKNRFANSKKDEENKLSNEAEEEERSATASTGVADNLGFFFSNGGFFHSAARSVPTWEAS